MKGSYLSPQPYISSYYQNGGRNQSSNAQQTNLSPLHQQTFLKYQPTKQNIEVKKVNASGVPSKNNFDPKIIQPQKNTDLIRLKNQQQNEFSKNTSSTQQKQSKLSYEGENNNNMQEQIKQQTQLISQQLEDQNKYKELEQQLNNITKEKNQLKLDINNQNQQIKNFKLVEIDNQKVINQLKDQHTQEIIQRKACEAKMQKYQLQEQQYIDEIVKLNQIIKEHEQQSKIKTEYPQKQLLKQLEDQNKQKDQELQQLKDQLQQKILNEQNFRVQQQKQELQEATKNFQLQIEQLKQEREYLNSQIEQYKQSAQQDKQNYENNIKNLKSEIEQLNKEKQQLDSQVQQHMLQKQQQQQNQLEETFKSNRQIDTLPSKQKKDLGFVSIFLGVTDLEKTMLMNKLFDNQNFQLFQPCKQEEVNCYFIDTESFDFENDINKREEQIIKYRKLFKDYKNEINNLFIVVNLETIEIMNKQIMNIYKFIRAFNQIISIIITNLDQQDENELQQKFLKFKPRSILFIKKDIQKQELLQLLQKQCTQDSEYKIDIQGTIFEDEDIY